MKLLYLLNNSKTVNELNSNILLTGIAYSYKWVSDEQSFLNQIQTEKYDILILDSSYLKENLESSLSSIKKYMVSSEIVILTEEADIHFLKRVVENGGSELIKYDELFKIYSVFKMLYAKKQQYEVSISLNKKLLNNTGKNLDFDAQKLLIENLDEAVYISVEDKFVYFNEYFCNLLGYEKDELKKINVRKILSEEGLNILNYRKRQAEKGLYVQSKYHSIFKTKQGEKIDVEINAKNIEYMESEATFCIIRNISEEIRNQISLKRKIESQHFLTTLTSLFAVTKADTFNQDIDTILEKLGTYTGVDRCSIFKFSISGKYANLFRYWSVNSKLVPFEKLNLSELNVERDQVRPEEFLIYEEDIAANHLKSKELEKFLLELKVKSFFCEPLIIDNKIWGLLIGLKLYNSKSWSSEEKDVLKIVGENISLALSRIKYERDLSKLSKAIEQSPNSVVITDKEIKIEYVNDRFLEVSGYSKAEIINKSPFYFMSDKMSQSVINDVTTATMNGQEWKGELLTTKKNGEDFWQMVRISPILDSDGKVTNYVGLMEDITEQKKYEEELNKHRMAMEAAKDGMAILDEDGNYIYLNEAQVRLYGYNKVEDLINKNYSIHYNGTFKKKFTYEIKPELLIKNYWSGELTGIKKDGSKFYQNLSLTKLRDGKMISILSDITYRKEVEVKLQESERKFRGFYENASIGIYRSTIEGRIVFANQTAIQMLGFKSLKEIQTVNLNDLYVDKKQRDVLVSDAKGGKRQIKKDLKLRRYNDGEIYVRLNSIIVELNGESYFEGTLEDITDRKMMEKEILKAKEKAEESDKLKSEFLAQMSHEIRTPINSMLSFVSLIKDEVTNANEILEESFGAIDSSGKRIIRTIDSILNMSELQTGSFEYNPSVFNISEKIFIPLAVEAKTRAQNKGLAFELSNDLDYSELFADEYSIYRIFDNLIDNAVKYTIRGKVEIKLYNDEEKRIVVEICDTGIGISENYLPNLFKPFTQQEQGYTRKFDGNGLGLALVKEYCNMNNAIIRVDSKQGVGSKFTVIFNH